MAMAMSGMGHFFFSRLCLVRQGGEGERDGDDILSSRFVLALAVFFFRFSSRVGLRQAAEFGEEKTA